MVRLPRPPFAPLLALPVLAACQPADRDPRGVATNETLVQVTATATARNRPDQARFSVGVRSVAGTGPEAAAANNRKMEAVVSALIEAGVARDDLQTQQLGISRLDYGPNRGQFEASNVVNARIRDIDKASVAIGAATGAGANVLSGPELSVADPESASRNAYAEAYKAARARADTYAAAAGMKVGRVLSIRDAGGARGPQSMAPAPVVVQSAAPPILAGLNENEVAVTVEFALVP